jgi:hypothetical protein
MRFAGESTRFGMHPASAWAAAPGAPGLEDRSQGMRTVSRTSMGHRAVQVVHFRSHRVPSRLFPAVGHAASVSLPFPPPSRLGVRRLAAAAAATVANLLVASADLKVKTLP